MTIFHVVTLIGDRMETFSTTDEVFASEYELRIRGRNRDFESQSFGDINGPAYTVVYYLKSQQKRRE